MLPSELKLRGYVQKESDGSWFGVCIDLNIVAQGDTKDEVRRKLSTFINDYLVEAYTVDKEYFDVLVPRKAPLAFLFRYYVINFLAKLHFPQLTDYARKHLFVEQFLAESIKKSQVSQINIIESEIKPKSSQVKTQSSPMKRQ